MKLKENSSLLFIGDSVTDCGRARPFAEGHYGQLGSGYPAIIQSLLDAYFPALNLRILNTGVSGDDVLRLKSRWLTDALELRPTYISIMIGINDVWHQFDSPRTPQRVIKLDTYTATLEELITSSLKSGVEKVILITPFYIEPNVNDNVRNMLDQYGKAVKALATKHNCILVDAQSAFDEACKYYHSSFYSADRVHPNLTGHTIIAKAFLEAIGADK